MKKKELKSLFEEVYKEFKDILSEVEKPIPSREYLRMASEKGPNGIVGRNVRWGLMSGDKFDIVLDDLLKKYNHPETTPQEKENINGTIVNAFYPHPGSLMMRKLSGIKGKVDPDELFTEYIYGGKKNWESFLTNRRENFGAQLVTSLKNFQIDEWRKEKSKKTTYIDNSSPGDDSVDMDTRMDMSTTDTHDFDGDYDDEGNSDVDFLARKAKELIDTGILTLKSFRNAASEISSITKDAIDSGAIKNDKVGIAFSESLIGLSKDAILSKFPNRFKSKAEIGSALQAIARIGSESNYKDLIEPAVSKIGLSVDDISSIDKWNYIEKILKDPEGFQIPKSEKNKGFSIAKPSDYGGKGDDLDDFYANRLEEGDIKSIMEAVIKRLKNLM